MAVSLHLIDPRLQPNVTPRRVAPVRFVRAVTDVRADLFSPDPDERGFKPCTHGPAHGPAVGFGAHAGDGPIYALRVMRDFIDDAAKLFPVVEDTGLVSVVFPTAGQPLQTVDTPDIFRDLELDPSPIRKANTIYLRTASAPAATSTTQLKLHYGSAGGPVVAEIALHVYPVLTIPVKLHIVSINGQAPNIASVPLPPRPNEAALPPETPAEQLNRWAALFWQQVNEIYAQAGIRYELRAGIVNEAVNSFTTAGAVTLTNVSDSLNQELQTVLNQNPEAGVLNAYVIDRYIDVTQPAGSQLGVLGIAFSSVGAARNGPTAAGFPGTQAGITFRLDNDMTLLSHTVAHEIGHSLTLEHYGNGNGAGIRRDLWANRNLMHNFVDLNNNANDQVGYGNYTSGTRRAGEWLGTKDIPAPARIPQSDQIRISREATQNATYAPILGRTP